MKDYQKKGGKDVRARATPSTRRHGPGKRHGTHALRKRCPICKKLRRFYEPPGDQGGERPDRDAGWKKIENRWICKMCSPQKRRPGASPGAGTDSRQGAGETR